MRYYIRWLLLPSVPSSVYFGENLLGCPIMQSNDRGALAVLAMALGSISFVVLITNPIEDMTSNILYHYQTLFAAAVAFAGAIIGALAIHRQIVLQRNLFMHDREGKMSAARALLPLALSSISQYAQECSDLLIALREECDGDGVLPDHISIPRIPPVPIDGMETIKEVIEFSEPADRSAPSELVSRIQIQRARMTGFYKRHEDYTVIDTNISSCIRDTADIYARTSAMFEFSRRRSIKMPSAEISREQLISAFHNLKIFDETLEEILEQTGLAPPT